VFTNGHSGHDFYDAMEHSFPPCTQTISSRLCVISSEEEEKCNHIRVAFRAAALSMSLECVVGVSDSDCVDNLNRGDADLAVISSHRADEFMHAGKLRPILAEIIDQKDYAVAVTLRVGRVRKLSDLKSGKEERIVAIVIAWSFRRW
jgi:hypothetical protein